VHFAKQATSSSLKQNTSKQSDHANAIEPQKQAGWLSSQVYGRTKW